LIIEIFFSKEFLPFKYELSLSFSFMAETILKSRAMIAISPTKKDAVC